ncbi:hypothetical protein K458DRAFT_486867 [Lentithecium fluviatile CBS 122367]|uniref:Uncharacterized protein n=1 Tax=Lentithecium fluviatile CBS 122367 TaxID=1168545 RepID=A0A6G1J412_9PLEO|nr:hypothetical protein K458DRAFT_486867 [Lentithecium fluviatile CBS 122367]
MSPRRSPSPIDVASANTSRERPDNTTSSPSSTPAADLSRASTPGLLFPMDPHPNTSTTQGHRIPSFGGRYEAGAFATYNPGAGASNDAGPFAGRSEHDGIKSKADNTESKNDDGDSKGDDDGG